jgi:hypothetical protein
MPNVYCVRDRKSATFWTPVFDRDHVQATRSFEVACRNPESQFAKWPGDFELLFLGEFDVKSGKFKFLEHPLVLADPMQFSTSPMVQSAVS